MNKTIQTTILVISGLLMTACTNDFFSDRVAFTKPRNDYVLEKRLPMQQENLDKEATKLRVPVENTYPLFDEGGYDEFADSHSDSYWQGLYAKDNRHLNPENSVRWMPPYYKAQAQNK